MAYINDLLSLLSLVQPARLYHLFPGFATLLCPLSQLPAADLDVKNLLIFEHFVASAFLCFSFSSALLLSTNARHCCANHKQGLQVLSCPRGGFIHHVCVCCGNHHIVGQQSVYTVMTWGSLAEWGQKYQVPIREMLLNEYRSYSV